MRLSLLLPPLVLASFMPAPNARADAAQDVADQECLESEPDPRRRLEAVQRLVASPYARFDRALLDEDVAVRLAALRGVLARDFDGDVADIAASITHPNAEVRAAAEPALIAGARSGRVDGLVGLFDDPGTPSAHRVRFLRALAGSPDTSAQHRFGAALADRDDAVRVEAERLLGQASQDERTRAIRACITIGPEKAESNAKCLALARELRIREAVPEIVFLLMEAGDVTLKGSAVQIPEATATLARAVLAELEPTTHLQAVETARTARSPGVRQGALRLAFVLSKEEATYQALVGALKDSNTDVQDTAAYLLGSLGDKRAVGPLSELVATAPEKARRKFESSLERLKRGRR